MTKEMKPMRTPVILAVVTIAATLIPVQAIHTQPAQLPQETMGLRDSGTGKVVLYLNSTDLNFRRRLVADFPKDEPAKAIRDQLNKMLPLSSPYFYEVDGRPR